MLTLSKGFDDESKVDEGKEDDIEFIEAREDAAEAFETPEESLDLIAFALGSLTVLKMYLFSRFYNDGNGLIAGTCKATIACMSI